MKSKRIDKPMQMRIEKLIDVYCTFMFGVDRDAGWHAPSQLESLVTACNKKRASFQRKQLTVRFAAGDERQANDRADEKMIDEIRFVRKKHYDFKFAKWLLEQLKENQLIALMAEPRLRISYKRKFKKQEIADYLEIPKKTYNTRRDAAVQWLEKELMRLEQYECLKIA